ncbi:hypothetical protein F5Y13DRAFT_184566 [Hypoxylon sp. FL1857]|nr:hypothetical protein F5Y13DRAFT_184566 [Hypoxylon sp. FL1857]
MGGVWLRGKPASDGATDASSTNLEETAAAPLICVETDILRTLIQARILEEDCLTRRMIDEKSKSDWLVKLIACWQAIYFGLQCLGRWGTGLPLTALELSTVAFTTYALALYLLWWHKPVDVAMPVVFNVSQQALDHVWRHNDPSAPWWRESFAWDNLNFANFTNSTEIRRIPNSFSSTGGLRRDFFSSDTDTNSIKMRAFAIFTAALATAQVAYALPPACLLAALGVQQNPSDLKAVCGTLQDAVQGNLTDNCHKDTLPKAYEVYSSKCLEQGVTVADLPTSTSSAHSSGTASASGPNSASATPTGSSSGTTGDSTSTTGASSSATPSGNAGMATEPQPFLFAAAALLATGLTSVVFL